MKSMIEDLVSLSSRGEVVESAKKGHATLERLRAEIKDLSDAASDVGFVVRRMDSLLGMLPKDGIILNAKEANLVALALILARSRSEGDAAKGMETLKRRLDREVRIR